ncbi:phage tail protein [Sodalis endosymbiont of Spalangia cameroni]|uniref:phage tail protein n=1 Tax=Sodalis praecaptivus TaxID=1239307 RepID=UPI0031F948AA
MLKPDSLRAALTAAVPYVAQNPDCLHIFIDEGAIVSTLAPSLSFEYQYTLNLVITDYADSADPLVVAILHWLRSHQPDIMANPDKRDKGFTFEVDFLDNAMRDISLNLRLTERVIVREDGGTLTVSHVDEPAPPPSDLSEVEIWMAGRKVAAWRN